ncbi:MAG: inner membrane protein YbaL [Pseudomonadota bacterium]|jgi:Kef-type K+ transport system membrane component KefB
MGLTDFAAALLRTLTLPADLALAGTGPSPLVQQLGLCLLAAGLLSALFERLRVPTIAALLGAGVLLGPVGLGLIQNAENVETIANLGLTLLLFVIGLEVNPRTLLASGRTLLVAGALQVPLTVMAGVGIFKLILPLFLADMATGYVALYLGLATGFSSTLLAVRFMQERRVLDTVSGRLSVGLLIFQDVWAIVVLALQPSFEAPEVWPILLTFAGILLVVVASGLGARFLLPRLFAYVAKTPELVVSVALAWCFGVGLFGGNLGRALALLGVRAPISVSMEMGALIAGMTIASFPYHHEVAAKVGNLRDFFVTLFFVALGMGIPVPDGAQVVVLAITLALITVLLRFCVFFPIFYAAGLDRANGLDASAKLAQISEFCLVIVYLGSKAGHIDDATSSVVVFAFVITALTTPLLFKLAPSLEARLGPALTRIGIKPPTGDELRRSMEHIPAQIVVLGFHRVAWAFLQDLGRQRPDLLPSTIVVDLNVRAHAAIKEFGVRVLYGDANSPEVLRHAGVEHARLVISTIPDELLRGTDNASLVRTVRSVSPGCCVFACASRSKNVPALYAEGASYVYMPPAETANGVLGAGLAALSGQLDSFRATRDAACGPLEQRPDVAALS